MANILKMIKDAAGMQKNVKKIQSQLRSQTVDFSSGNGLVTVTARGDASIAVIHIDPRALDAEHPAACHYVKECVGCGEIYGGG